MRFKLGIWKAMGGGAIVGASVLAVSMWHGLLIPSLEGAAIAAHSIEAPGTMNEPSEASTERKEWATTFDSTAGPDPEHGSAPRHSHPNATAIFAPSASLGTVAASHEVRTIADWVARSGDNQGHDFIIVDKAGAHLYLFDSYARLYADTSVLVGSAIGDHSVPDIGTRPIAAIKPEERTTPAGRFIAEPGHNADDIPVIWIDHSVAVSMHAVRSEQRQRRLDTPGIDDNRASYGCINVPRAFFDEQVRKVFSGRRAIVYVLPDVLALREVFPGVAQSNQASGRTPPSRIALD